MILLNLRFQHDTPKGQTDIHAFVEDQGSTYLVHCGDLRVECPNIDIAIRYIYNILERCKAEVKNTDKDKLLGGSTS